VAAGLLRQLTDEVLVFQRSGQANGRIRSSWPACTRSG
jgi:hypothetical protein